jgi:hypothetical protein
MVMMDSAIQSRESNKPVYQPRAIEDNPCSEKALPSYKYAHFTNWLMPLS